MLAAAFCRRPDTARLHAAGFPAFERERRRTNLKSDFSPFYPHLAWQWKPSENRGYYYGSSKDTRWNHDQAWRSYVDKQNNMDTQMQHQMEEAARRAAQTSSRGGTQRGATGSRTAGGRTAKGVRTGDSATVGLESVQGLVRALTEEQEQRLLKEKALEELLLKESVERARAQEDLRKLERKVDHLMDRLADPGMPAVVRNTVLPVKHAHKKKGLGDSAASTGGKGGKA